MLKKVFISIASAASILSLALTNSIPSWLQYIIAAFGIGCLVYLLFLDYLRGRDNLIVCKSEQQTRDCLKDWIKQPGKVCIMTRDLSWVDAGTEECLIKKSNSVLIFAQGETELTSRLTAKGVDIRFYDDTGFEPQTRFTVIRYNKTDRQIAIANTRNTIRKKNNYRHTIYQTSTHGDLKDMWIMSLATDLIDMCKCTCRNERKESE